MLETYFRDDLGLTLVRLFDRVSLNEQLEAARRLLIEENRPRFHYPLLVDARRMLDYPLGQPEMMRLAARLATVYLGQPTPLVMRVLTGQDWQRQAAQRFAACARLVNNIAVDLFSEEKTMLAHCRKGRGTLETLFPPQCLYARYPVH